MNGINKIGLSFNKVSFGKGYSSDKGYSSNSIGKGYSSDKGYSCGIQGSSVRHATRGELLDKLIQYSNDPVMVRIITEQLRRLG